MMHFSDSFGAPERMERYPSYHHQVSRGAEDMTSIPDFFSTVNEVQRPDHGGMLATGQEREVQQRLNEWQQSSMGGPYFSQNMGVQPMVNQFDRSNFARPLGSEHIGMRHSGGMHDPLAAQINQLNQNHLDRTAQSNLQNFGRADARGDAVGYHNQYGSLVTGSLGAHLGMGFQPDLFDEGDFLTPKQIKTPSGLHDQLKTELSTNQDLDVGQHRGLSEQSSVSKGCFELPGDAAAADKICHQAAERPDAESIVHSENQYPQTAQKNKDDKQYFHEQPDCNQSELFNGSFVKGNGKDQSEVGGHVTNGGAIPEDNGSLKSHKVTETGIDLSSIFPKGKSETHSMQFYIPTPPKEKKSMDKRSSQHKTSMSISHSEPSRIDESNHTAADDAPSSPSHDKEAEATTDPQTSPNESKCGNVDTRRNRPRSAKNSMSRRPMFTETESDSDMEDKDLEILDLGDNKPVTKEELHLDLPSDITGENPMLRRSLEMTEPVSVNRYHPISLKETMFVLSRPKLDQKAECDIPDIDKDQGGLVHKRKKPLSDQTPAWVMLEDTTQKSPIAASPAITASGKRPEVRQRARSESETSDEQDNDDAATSNNELRNSGSTEDGEPHVLTPESIYNDIAQRTIARNRRRATSDSTDMRKIAYRDLSGQSAGKKEPQGVPRKLKPLFPRPPTGKTDIKHDDTDTGGRKSNEREKHKGLDKMTRSLSEKHRKKSSGKHQRHNSEKSVKRFTKDGVRETAKSMPDLPKSGLSQHKAVNLLNSKHDSFDLFKSMKLNSSPLQGLSETSSYLDRISNKLSTLQYQISAGKKQGRKTSDMLAQSFPAPENTSVHRIKKLNPLPPPAAASDITRHRRSCSTGDPRISYQLDKASPKSPKNSPSAHPSPTKVPENKVMGEGESRVKNTGKSPTSSHPNDTLKSPRCQADTSNLGQAGRHAPKSMNNTQVVAEVHSPRPTMYNGIGPTTENPQQAEPPAMHNQRKNLFDPIAGFRPYFSVDDEVDEFDKLIESHARIRHFEGEATTQQPAYEQSVVVNRQVGQYDTGGGVRYNSDMVLDRSMEDFMQEYKAKAQSRNHYLHEYGGAGDTFDDL